MFILVKLGGKKSRCGEKKLLKDKFLLFFLNNDHFKRGKSMRCQFLGWTDCPWPKKGCELQNQKVMGWRSPPWRSGKDRKWEENEMTRRWRQSLPMTAILWFLRVCQISQTSVKSCLRWLVFWTSDKSLVACCGTLRHRSNFRGTVRSPSKMFLSTSKKQSWNQQSSNLKCQIVVYGKPLFVCTVQKKQVMSLTRIQMVTD